jgi:hypothetical protein
VTAVVGAVLCNANGDKPIAQWLHAQSVDFWHFPGFSLRPIRYGALRNLLLVLSPEAFEAALAAWLREVHGGDLAPEALQGVSIDGKALRGTQTLDQRALLLIAADDQETASVLRQQAVPADTNEQKAVRDRLRQICH